MALLCVYVEKTRLIAAAVWEWPLLQNRERGADKLMPSGAKEKTNGDCRNKTTQICRKIQLFSIFLVKIA